MEIRRDYYLEKLIKRKNNGLIKVITGIRYCGKSYLLNNLFYNHLIWIPTNHRSVKIKFHKHRLNGVHEAEPDTWISHLFYN